MVDQAIKNNTGRIEFFQTELKAFTSGDPKAEKARLRAVASLQTFQSFPHPFAAGSRHASVALEAPGIWTGNFGIIG